MQRFISEDPLEFLGGDLNLYTYVFNDPANKIDPTGQFGIAGAVGGAAFNFAVQFGAAYYMSGFDWKTALKCVNWTDVLVSAAVGAAGPTFLGNVVLGKVDPASELTRAANTAIWSTLSVPVGFSLKQITPDFRFGNKCECQGLGVVNVLSQLAN